MTSKFNDSSWTILVDPYTYRLEGDDATVVKVDGTNDVVVSSDIYITTNRCGVYLLNGSSTTINEVFPIFCSTQSLPMVGARSDSDDAYLVYPGYGFKLFNNTGYTGTMSNLYYNTLTKPVIFCTTTTWPGCPAINNTTGEVRQNDITSSIKIYFRGEEQIIQGMS